MPADERRLVERLKRRDEATFNELVRKNQGPLYRMLVRLLGDPAEAEDVAQEVFISVFKAIESFRGDAALSTWLHRIAANHAHNRRKYLARRGRDAQRPFEERADAIDAGTFGPRPHTPHQLVESLQAERHVQQALSELDDEQRLLITLRDLEDMSYEDIRQVTGLPIGTVKSKLHRARMALHLRFAALQKGTP